LNPILPVNELPVYERFHSWQGEGIHSGRSAFFIRLHGCPVHCPWCDSAGTWHPDHKPDHIDRLSPIQLAEEAFSSGCEFVVITGGEPAIHNLHDLTYELRIRNLPIHLETCGAYSIKGEMDWITLSPKNLAPPIDENLAVADEFKIIIEDKETIQNWLNQIPFPDLGVPTWLHPEWSLSQDILLLSSINDWVKKHGAPYRAGFQMHKLYLADESDQRSKPTAALCDSPSKVK
jgi:7-carboxy-7-deazaguanine synthase